MAVHFDSGQWDDIAALAESDPGRFRIPRRRTKSVLIGTFNIREFGKTKSRPAKARRFLASLAERFDLLAIQEVGDDLEALEDLHAMLGSSFHVLVSDVTGVYPGDRGNPERLAFLFKHRRIDRTELASDITVDRSKVADELFENRADFARDFRAHAAALTKWKRAVEKARREGRKKPDRPPLTFRHFVTFIRQPHCASFQILGRNGAPPTQFLTVNAHLLFGTDKTERKLEFEALFQWLFLRAKQADRLYHKNLLLMGDLNLEVEAAGLKRADVERLLRALNHSVLRSRKAAKVNFPLLTAHPEHGELRTNLRNDETFDQVAFFDREGVFPDPDANDAAGTGGANGYDYGVMDLRNLLAEAVHGQRFDDLTARRKDALLARAKQDVSDHLPVWVRLPIPGT